jgi:MFS family permease
MSVTGSFLVTKRQAATLNQPLGGNPEDPEKQNVANEDVIGNIERIVSRISVKSEKVTTLKQGLFDKKFILVFSVSGLLPIYLIYLMQNLKLIYMPIINDDHFLSYCAAVVTASAFIGAPFWGALGDSKGFKNTLLMIAIADTCVKFFGIYSVSKWSLVILFLLLGANDRGLLTIVGPGLIGMFGVEMATELIPYKGLALILAYSVAPIMQILLSDISHLNLLEIFLGYSFICVILCIFLKVKIHYR